MFKKVLFSVFCFLIIITLAGCGSTPAATDQEKTTKEAEKARETKSKGEYNIGDEVELDNNIVIVVEGVREGTIRSDLIEPDPEKRILVAMIKVINNSDEEITVAPAFMLNLFDKEGMSYKFDVTADLEGMLSGPLPPGKQMKGEEAWAVPKNLTEFELSVRNDIGGSTKRINITFE